MQTAKPPVLLVDAAKPLVYYIKGQVLFVCLKFVAYLLLNGWADFDETF